MLKLVQKGQEAPGEVMFLTTGQEVEAIKGGPGQGAIGITPYNSIRGATILMGCSSILGIVLLSQVHKTSLNIRVHKDSYI